MSDQSSQGLNLARRVKRQVWAREWEAFATCAPGLEEITATQLRALAVSQVAPTPGGVAFMARLEGIYAANLWLRTSGRVLMRLADFRVRGWDDLLRQLAAIPWEVFAPAGAALWPQVSLHNSNLRHEGRIAEEVVKAAARRLNSQGIKPIVPAPSGDRSDLRLFVRGYGRRASISLDTSGEHLSRRGYRHDPGPAPLREDLAAGLLLHSGYDGSQPLVDAMCGAGTLAIEAALIARRLPPALERGLALEGLPCHREAAWGHLRRKAREEALAAPPQAIAARDVAADSLSATKANAERAGVLADLALNQADFFQSPPPPGPGLVVLNPPYGKRLGSVRQAQSLARNLGKRLAQAYKGWRVGVVLYRPEWLDALPLKDASVIVIPHGGLTVSLARGEVSG